MLFKKPGRRGQRAERASAEPALALVFRIAHCATEEDLSHGRDMLMLPIHCIEDLVVVAKGRRRSSVAVAEVWIQSV
ncbi:g2631 [Coccomyxa elongata]